MKPIEAIGTENPLILDGDSDMNQILERLNELEDLLAEKNGELINQKRQLTESKKERDDLKEQIAIQDIKIQSITDQAKKVSQENSRLVRVVESQNSTIRYTNRTARDAMDKVEDMQNAMQKQAAEWEEESIQSRHEYGETLEKALLLSQTVALAMLWIHVLNYFGPLIWTHRTDPRLLIVGAIALVIIIAISCGYWRFWTMAIDETDFDEIHPIIRTIIQIIPVILMIGSIIIIHIL